MAPFLFFLVIHPLIFKIDKKDIDNKSKNVYTVLIEQIRILQIVRAERGE